MFILEFAQLRNMSGRLSFLWEFKLQLIQSEQKFCNYKDNIFQRDFITGLSVNAILRLNWFPFLEKPFGNSSEKVVERVHSDSDDGKKDETWKWNHIFINKYEHIT